MIVIKTPAEKLSKQGQAGAKLLAKQGQTSKTILSSDKISKGIWKSNNIDNKIHASYYENNIFFYQPRRQQMLYLPLQRGWCDPEQYKSTNLQDTKN